MKNPLKGVKNLEKYVKSRKIAFKRVGNKIKLRKIQNKKKVNLGFNLKILMHVR